MANTYTKYEIIHGSSCDIVFTVWEWGYNHYTIFHLCY